MPFDTDTRTWSDGDVAYFFKLHSDTAECVGSGTCRCKEDGEEEWIQNFCVEGKKRPCIILQKNGRWFRVWNGTTKSKTGSRRFRVSPDKHLREITVALEVRAIETSHERLAGKWCGEVNKLLLQAAYDETIQLRAQER